MAAPAKKGTKKIEAYVRLVVKAGEANPSPPVGPALGQRGVNIMEFCKDFNARTAQMKKGMPLPVVISVYGDRSFTYVIKTPPASYLLLEAIGQPKGSSNPNTTKIGSVKRTKLAEIAKIKEPDLTAASVEAAINTIAGTARSMGIEVVEG